MIGENLAGYRIVGMIGRGAQGVVYAAQCQASSREVAVKVLPPSLALDEAAVQRFLDVARALTSIRHPGVVRVDDYGRDDVGRGYMVMERLEGETLFERLRRSPLTIEQAVTIAQQIARTLDVLHAHEDQPLVHRDIKPENVVLVREGQATRVVLVDFGIAKLASTTGTLSGAGAFGSPPYMSPEQCRGDRSLDHRTDLYALGCLLYEMISGAPPFGFGNLDELLRAHLEVEPPSLLEADPSVPPSLAAIVGRLLAKSPDERPSSAAAVLGALDALELPASSPPPPGPHRHPTLPSATGPLAGPSDWSRRSFERLLGMPPWVVAGGACAVGATLLAVSIVLGVGDSYLSSPNWGFSYVVLVPLMMGLMTKLVQSCDRAFREDEPGLYGEARRMGAWIVTLMTWVVLPVSLLSSVGELIERVRAAPIAGTWWTESPIVGVMGSVAQGIVTAALIGFVIHGVAWSQLASRARRRGDRPESFEQPLELTFQIGVLAQTVLYLSNVQHIAETRGLTLVKLLLAPLEGVSLDRPGGFFDVGTGLYPSLTTWIASGMIVAFIAFSLTTLRQARKGIAMLALLLASTIFFRLGPVVFAILGGLTVWRLAFARRHPAGKTHAGISGGPLPS